MPKKGKEFDVDHTADPLYLALVAAIKVAAREHGADSREYWRVQALITDLRPNCAKADPKSPLQETEDPVAGASHRTGAYADRSGFA